MRTGGDRISHALLAKVKSTFSLLGFIFRGNPCQNRHERKKKNRHETRMKMFSMVLAGNREMSVT